MNWFRRVNIKSRIVMFSILSIILVLMLLVGDTYSIFVSSNIDENLNVYKTGNLDITYTLSEDNVNFLDVTPVSLENSSFIKPYRVTVNNAGTVPYMFDLKLLDTTSTEVISYEYIMVQVGKLDPISLNTTTNNIIKEDIIVPAGDNVIVDVRVWLSDTVKNTEIGKSFYAKLMLDGIAIYDDSNDINNSMLIADYVNKPNLDTGFVPVYYDSVYSVWRKADKNNKDNSWYNYKDKKWANAVLVDDTNINVSTIDDISGNGNNAMVYGASITDEGLVFDGIDDYAVVDSIDYSDTTAITIDFVAKIDEDDVAILFESSVNSNENEGSFYIDTNEVSVDELTLAMKYRNSGLTNHKMVDGIIDENNFKQYTIIFDSTNSYDNFISMYFDGEKDTVANWPDGNVYDGDLSGKTLTNYPFYIASRAGSQYFTNMILKNLRIYNRALSDTEVLSNYQGNVVKEGLILNYDFINTINDLSGNGNYGVLHGASITSEGLSFDGVDDYVETGVIDYNNATAITIDFEAKIDENNVGILLESSIDSNKNNGSFYINTNEKGINDITLAMKYKNLGLINHKMVDRIINKNSFKHYTIVFDSTRSYDNFISMYLNGVEKFVTNWPDGNVYDGDLSGKTLTNYPLYIASRGGSTYFTNMILKNLRVYNRALSNEEIVSNNNGVIVEDGLILNYDFVDMGNSDRRKFYKDAKVGTVVDEEDVLGYYVWIPRFKYRVWNITRQAGNEDTYAYPAYTNGIEIEWEMGTRSTGNVECTYNVNTVEGDANLSDVCVFDDTETITTTSGNANYTDAWYTHPAFDFGGVPKSGFWMGKFETTGTSDKPTVLPDQVALTNQNISTQFTTAKKIRTYGLSNKVDVHMLTNLEWGAVSYLTHSIYGLCDSDNGCRDVYINNSSMYYTGRSFGDFATNSTASNYGKYDYKGYLLNDNGVVTTSKNIYKVGSTTGNITGVYDMSGGAYEYVMANMVGNDGNFTISDAGESWDGSSILNNKYYNAYSYGTTNYGRLAFNRAYLGDATAEVAINTLNNNAAWKPGVTTIGSHSYFLNTDGYFGSRGGMYSYAGSGLFSYSYSNGGAIAHYSFRSSIS